MWSTEVTESTKWDAPPKDAATSEWGNASASDSTKSEWATASNSSGWGSSARSSSDSGRDSWRSSSSSGWTSSSSRLSSRPNSRACYNCGEEGHISRDCSKPRESRGRPASYNREGREYRRGARYDNDNERNWRNDRYSRNEDRYGHRDDDRRSSKDRDYGRDNRGSSSSNVWGSSSAWGSSDSNASDCSISTSTTTNGEPTSWNSTSSSSGSFADQWNAKSATSTTFTTSTTEPSPMLTDESSSTSKSTEPSWPASTISTSPTPASTQGSAEVWNASSTPPTAWDGPKSSASEKSIEDNCIILPSDMPVTWPQMRDLYADRSLVHHVTDTAANKEDALGIMYGWCVKIVAAIGPDGSKIYSLGTISGTAKLAESFNLNGVTNMNGVWIVEPGKSPSLYRISEISSQPITYEEYCNWCARYTALGILPNIKLNDLLRFILNRRVAQVALDQTRAILSTK